MANQYEIHLDRAGGLVDVYTKKDLDDLSGVFAVDLVGDELTVDTLTPCVNVDPDAIEFIAPADYDYAVTADGFTLATSWAETRNPLTLEHGAAVRAYKNGALFAKGFFDDAEQTGPDMYQINVVSPVGMLLKRPHRGGIYTGESFAQVCADIIGDAFPFSVADDVAALAIYGWLPYADSARDNLHQLLFACGVSMLRDEFGDVIFCFLFDSEAGTLEDATIYRDNGSIKHSAPATQVSVTEHTFVALDSDERVTVFDNTDGSGAADRRLVTFSDAPIHHLEATGLTVHEQGANYAVVSGTGTLTGQKYTHITQIVTADNNVAGQTPNVVSVTSMTLVSIVNSENVAKRVLAYNVSQRTIKAGLVFHAEQCGRKYAFNDPWGSPVTAFLASMTLTMSNIIKADAELIAGYVPTGHGNNFTHAVVLTGAGSWTVPDDVDTVKAVLISGGEGGSSGGNGHTGGSGSTSSYGTGGAGGEPGTAGSGGRILSVTVEVSNLDTVDYSCGAGGAGGVSAGTAPTPGALGGDTVFGPYTTADGQVSTAGVVNLFTGAVYGLSGNQDGVAGLAGGGPSKGPESLVFEGVTYSGGAKGANVSGYVDGVACGGWGGGPAAGANGSDGIRGQTESMNGAGFNDGGDGGKGGSPVARAAATVPGQGGDAGHGGGGGGGGGAATGTSTKWIWQGDGGSGGTGGQGGDGGPGCIILYY